MYNGRRNHIIANCPFCSKEGHFFFNINKALEKNPEGKYKYCWDCKKCTEKGNIVKLLRKLDKLFLLEGEYVGDGDFIENPLKKLGTASEEELGLIAKEIRIPIGFKRMYSDPYLESRGFTEHEFNKYEIGYTNTSAKYEDYIIILFREMAKVRGFIARSRLPKEEIKAINKSFKQKGLKQRYLRYRNSSESEFSKMLGGFEEIMITTSWVVLVEGYFDKVAVDRALALDKIQDMKCCFTFGKDVSKEQITKLKKRGIRGVILVQDPDAVDYSKALGLKLQKHFDEVMIGFTGNKDLGDSTDVEILSVFDNLKKPEMFNLEIVGKKIVYG